MIPRPEVHRKRGKGSTYIKIVLLVSTGMRLRMGTYVGCNLVHAGNQPLKMNIGPSFANLLHQYLLSNHVPVLSVGTSNTLPPQEEVVSRDREGKTYEVLITPAIVACPEAVIIRDFSTSAGEQTANHQLGSLAPFVYVLVAIVPYKSASYPMLNREK
jgi:hypothetical protein